jgi:hypothetical protein
MDANVKKFHTTSLQLKWLYPLFLFILLVIIVSCSSSNGAKSLKKGNYYTATIEAVNKLRSSPDKQDVQNVLTSAYPLAVKMALHEIDNALTSNNASKYDVIVSQYEQLNRMADEIYHSPKAYELIPQPQEFQAELQSAKNSAAEQSYALGVKALSYGTIEQARIAHQHLLKAHNYVNGYRDVIDKIDDALYAATLRVIVEAPITPANFQVSAEFFYNNLLSEMSKRTETKYVRLYTPEEAKKENMRNPHQYMVLDFAAFNVGNINEVKNTTEVKRDSVVTGTVNVGGKNYDAYATVKAKFTKYQREIASSGTLDVRILDASNSRVIEQRKFNGSYVWKTTWGSYTGDDRALTKEQKDLSKREPQLPPPNQDLFIEFTKPIYTQVVSYVRTFYGRKVVN